MLYLVPVANTRPLTHANGWICAFLPEQVKPLHGGGRQEGWNVGGEQEGVEKRADWAQEGVGSVVAMPAES